jgi:hypothetical protein
VLLLYTQTYTHFGIKYNTKIQRCGYPEILPEIKNLILIFYFGCCCFPSFSLSSSSIVKISLDFFFYLLFCGFFIVIYFGCLLFFSFFFSLFSQSLPQTSKNYIFVHKLESISNCTLSCALLLSNVSFDIHDCSNESRGIDCMHAMDVLLFWVCRRSHNREGWVLFFLLFDLRF